MAASTSHAPLAENEEQGRWAVRPAGRLVVGYLLEDGVPAVGGLGLQHLQGGVGEHGVVPVGGKQLTLPGGNGCGVEGSPNLTGHARLPDFM